MKEIDYQGLKVWFDKVDAIDLCRCKCFSCRIAMRYLISGAQIMDNHLMWKD